MVQSNPVVYTSKVRIERKSGPMRLAYLPAGYGAKEETIQWRFQTAEA
jgi:hypothetical protein